MKTAIYAGSFDPLTLGHMDIIKSGADIFDKLIIGVTQNTSKKEFIPIKDRVLLIKDAVSGIKNVEVAVYKGLTVDFAKENNADVILRGLRNSSDFEYEKELAQVNAKLCCDIKTVFIMTKPEHSYISSSAVREIITYKGIIKNFVPVNVENYFLKLAD